jgi:hypothetical protein
MICNALKNMIMYFQVFTKSKINGKYSQFSCDNFEEVQELIEKKMPKFLYYEAHNSEGLIGTAYKYFSFKTQNYQTYKKEMLQA